MKVPKLQKQYLPVQSGIGIQSGDPGAFTAGIGQLGQKIADVLGQQHNIKLSKQNRIMIEGEKQNLKTEFYNFNDQFKSEMELGVKNDEGQTLKPDMLQGEYNKRLAKFMKDSQKKLNPQAFAEVQSELMWESRLVYDEIRDNVVAIKGVQIKDNYKTKFAPSMYQSAKNAQTPELADSFYQSHLNQLVAIKGVMDKEEYEEEIELMNKEHGKIKLFKEIKQKIKEKTLGSDNSEKILALSEEVTLSNVIKHLEKNGFELADGTKIDSDNPYVQELISDYTEDLDKLVKNKAIQNQAIEAEVKEKVTTLFGKLNETNDIIETKNIVEELRSEVDKLPPELREKYRKYINNEVSQTETSEELYETLLLAANSGFLVDANNDEIIDYVNDNLLTSERANEIIRIGKEKRKELDKLLTNPIHKNNIKAILTATNGSQELIDKLTAKGNVRNLSFGDITAIFQSESGKYNQASVDAIQIYLEAVQAGKKMGFTEAEILSGKLVEFGPDNKQKSTDKNLVESITTMVKAEDYRTKFSEIVRNSKKNNKASRIVIINGNPAYVTDAEYIGMYFAERLDNPNTVFDQEWRERRTFKRDEKLPNGDTREIVDFESVEDYNKRMELFVLAKNSRTQLDKQSFINTAKALQYNPDDIISVANELYDPKPKKQTKDEATNQAGQKNENKSKKELEISEMLKKQLGEEAANKYLDDE